MIHRSVNCNRKPGISRKETFLAAWLTIGSALVVAAIILSGRNEVTEAIGMTMFPGVLAVGPQSIYMRRRSVPVRIAVIGGTFVVLALIGLAAGLAIAA